MGRPGEGLAPEASSQAAADALLEALLHADPSRPVLLTGPIGPDGDSIGACLALQRVLRARGRRALVAGRPSYRYRWMPGAEAMVPDERLDDDYAAVVVLDGDRHRLTRPAARAFQNAPIRGLVDHHESTRPDGYTHPWIEPTAASTCSMIHDALARWAVPLDRDLAALLYAGLIFDTGGFRYTNTTPQTHRMAAELLATGIPHADICTRVLAERREAGLRLAGDVFTHTRFALDGQLAIGVASLALQEELGLVDGDLEGIVDALVHVVGVEVAVLLVERRGGAVKLSLRSRGRVNVAEVAAALVPSGGGHAKAAGAVLDTDVARAIRLATKQVAARLG